MYEKHLDILFAVQNRFHLKDDHASILAVCYCEYLNQNPFATRTELLHFLCDTVIEIQRREKQRLQFELERKVALPAGYIYWGIV